MAVHNYNDTNGCIPGNWETTSAGVGVSAIYLLLPFLEQQNLFTQGAPSEGAYENVASFIPKVFVSPLDSSLPGGTFSSGGVTWGVCNYATNHAIFGIPDVSWNASRTLVAGITDGTSNTVLFAEKYGLCGSGGSLWAYRPSDPQGWPTMSFFAPNWTFAELQQQQPAEDGRPAAEHTDDPQLQSLQRPGDDRRRLPGRPVRRQRAQRVAGDQQHDLVRRHLAQRRHRLGDGLVRKRNAMTRSPSRLPAILRCLGCLLLAALAAGPGCSSKKTATIHGRVTYKGASRCDGRRLLPRFG